MRDSPPGLLGRVAPEVQAVRAREPRTRDARRLWSWDQGCRVPSFRATLPFIRVPCGCQARGACSHVVRCKQQTEPGGPPTPHVPPPKTGALSPLTAPSRFDLQNSLPWSREETQGGRSRQSLA